MRRWIRTPTVIYIYFFLFFLIRVKPPESKTIHQHCGLVLFSIHSTQAIQRLLLLINTYRYLHMYSRQAQVSEERAYRVSLLHISKDNCVYEIVMICAAYTDPLKKKQWKQKSSNNQSLKRGNSSKTDFHPLETWLMESVLHVLQPCNPTGVLQRDRVKYLPMSLLHSSSVGLVSF